MCWLFYTSLQNKTHYRRVAPFARSQKSQHKYIVSKLLSGLETSFPNKRHDGGGGGGGGGGRKGVGIRICSVEKIEKLICEVNVY